jgi:hypothetical protein
LKKRQILTPQEGKINKNDKTRSEFNQNKDRIDVIIGSFQKCGAEKTCEDRLEKDFSWQSSQ